MGIRGEFDDISDADIDALVSADELLADVLREFRDSFRRANEANREVAGEYVPYTVEIDGKTVYSGNGQVFPENQIGSYIGLSDRERRRQANVELGRKLRELIVKWMWSRVNRRLIYAGIRGFAAIGGLIDDDGRPTLRVGLRAARLVGTHLLSGDNENEIDALIWISQELVASSPVFTGAYREAHALYADGAEVGSAEEIFSGADIPAADEYVFVSQSPYARKLEVREGFEVYESVAARAQAEFPETYIAFEWRESDLAGLPSGGRRPYRFPSIVVTPR